MKSETKDSVDQQIDRAFLLITGRQPTDVERAASVSAIAENGLAVLCRVLFNSNEFLFIP